MDPHPRVGQLEWLDEAIPDARPLPNSRKAPRNAGKRCDFGDLGRPQLWLSTGLNYTPSAPELRLIATPLSGQIEYTKRCVPVPGK